jgi:hypothetical protein
VLERVGQDEAIRALHERRVGQIREILRRARRDGGDFGRKILDRGLASASISTKLASISTKRARVRCRFLPVQVVSIGRAGAYLYHRPACAGVPPRTGFAK